MAILILTLLALVFGLGLGYAAIRFKVEGDPIVEKIDALLPQTQCGNVGILVVVLMQKPLPVMKPK
jgi:electron transport complex protein RnfB